MPTKICTRCNFTLALSMFSTAPTCKDGHRNYCKSCQKKTKDAWRALHKEHHNEKGREWRKNNPEKAKEFKTNWIIKNPDYMKTYHREYRRANKLLTNINTSMRRKRVRQATPIWADKETIKDFYMEAQYFNLQVDHIVPLIHEAVCGLHVPDNMQLLSLSENARKGNRFAII